MSAESDALKAAVDALSAKVDAHIAADVAKVAAAQATSSPEDLAAITSVTTQIAAITEKLV